MVTQPQVLASPYKVGSSVSSVELLLAARTAADGVIHLANRRLGASTRLANPLLVTGVSPGPADSADSIRFVAEAKSGALGSLLVEAPTVVALADVIMGGRGVGDGAEPSELELSLFGQRFLTPVGVLLDAVAPGRPDPLELIRRDIPTAARSIVVELSLELGDEIHVFLLEVLAHHLVDASSDLGPVRDESVCSDVPMELTFRFPPVRLPAREVAALEPGDVICLEHEIGGRVVGEVGGKPLVSGRTGLSRQHTAVEILDLIEGENNG